MNLCIAQSNNMYLLYLILEDNIPRYLNISNRPENEILAWHKNKRTKQKDLLYQALNEKDINKFQLQILQKFDNINDARKELDIQIKIYAQQYTLYNSTNIVSNETRTKQSISLSGNNNGNYNKPVAEHIKNKMRNTLQKSIQHGINLNAQAIKCITTNEIFPSIKLACDKYNLAESSLHRALNNNLPLGNINNKQLFWKYVNKYDNGIYKVYQIYYRNTIVYIGKTSQSVKDRFYNHCTNSESAIYNFIQKHGINNFTYTYIDNLSDEEAIKLEKELIHKHQDTILNKILYKN